MQFLAHNHKPPNAFILIIQSPSSTQITREYRILAIKPPYILFFLGQLQDLIVEKEMQAFCRRLIWKQTVNSSNIITAHFKWLKSDSLVADGVPAFKNHLFPSFYCSVTSVCAFFLCLLSIRIYESFVLN